MKPHTQHLDSATAEAAARAYVLARNIDPETGLSMNPRAVYMRRYRATGWGSAAPVTRNFWDEDEARSLSLKKSSEKPIKKPSKKPTQKPIKKLTNRANDGFLNEVPLPPNFKPKKSHKDLAKKLRYTREGFESAWDVAVRYYHGRTSANWDTAFRGFLIENKIREEQHEMAGLAALAEIREKGVTARQRLAKKKGPSEGRPTATPRLNLEPSSPVSAPEPEPSSPEVDSSELHEVEFSPSTPDDAAEAADVVVEGAPVAAVETLLGRPISDKQRGGFWVSLASPELAEARAKGWEVREGVRNWYTPELGAIVVPGKPAVGALPPRMQGQSQGEDEDQGEVREVPEALADAWQQVCRRLRAEVGLDVFNSWFGRLEIDEVTDEGYAHLSVPTKFLKSWIQSHYTDRILTALSAAVPRVESLIIRVRTR